ncbi:MAG: beta-lactamase family protein [Deltaproteobacteria bacterium]|nr:beta-lactamase family protein [Deltaproteobacteria bacterium]
MFRLALCVSLVVVGCGGATSSSPPSPAKPVVTAPPPPANPAPAPLYDAQAQVTQWLAAFNASDASTLAAFTTNRFAPELAKEFPSGTQLTDFREHTGGFDVTKPEEVTPNRFSALVKERGADQYARIVLELDAAGRVSRFDIDQVPTPDGYRPARLSEADALAALRTKLDALVAKDQFSGAVLVAKHGKPIFAQAYGLADRDTKFANTVDTRFRIGSMNKMFTATAILQLVQARKLSLDDTVGKHLPDYPNKHVAEQVTIHHLLTHSGGTGDIFGPDYDAKRLALRTLQDYVTLYGTRELLHEPGQDNKYSNYGFVLLGVIIERVTKRSYYDHLQASIFKPAKMLSTSSPFEDKPARGRSIAYTKDVGGKRVAAWADAKDTLPIRATSAGGGDSTVGDLSRFATALTSHRLLDKKHTDLLTARKTGELAGGYAYGFGVSVEDDVDCFGHGGGAQGMNGDLQICSSGYTIAVLANLDPPAAGRVLLFIKARLPK